MLKKTGRSIPGLWERPRGHRRRVLVIDDYRPIRALIEDASRHGRLPCDVKTASNVEDGLMLAARYHPDVILLDHFFGKNRLQGDAAIAFIRRAKAIRKVVVIGVSTNTTIGKKMMDAGADGFLQKPFTLEELRKELVLHLNRT